MKHLRELFSVSEPLLLGALFINIPVEHKLSVL